VLARLMGLPEAEIPGLIHDIELIPTHHPDAMAAFMHMAGVIAQHASEQRNRAGSGLTARLINHPARLTDDEISSDMLYLTGLGQNATADWLGNALRLMLIDDEFSLALQGGRSSAEQALNEVLWQDTPIQNVPSRWATQDCELGGRRIARGDLLVLSFAAANADPLVQPDSFADVSVNRAHMSFGHGYHACPYAAPELAGVMAKTAIEVLLDRIPDVELTVPDSELAWKESALARGLHALPVRFSPISPAGIRR
jgi:cytochrome P450